MTIRELKNHSRLELGLTESKNVIKIRLAEKEDVILPSCYDLVSTKYFQPSSKEAINFYAFLQSGFEIERDDPIFLDISKFTNCSQLVKINFFRGTTKKTGMIPLVIQETDVYCIFFDRDGLPQQYLELLKLTLNIPLDKNIELRHVKKENDKWRVMLTYRVDACIFGNLPSDFYFFVRIV